MKKSFVTITSSILALSLISAVPVYADNSSDYTCEIKELPYEASVVSSIGGKYFQLKQYEFDKSKEEKGGYHFYDNGWHDCDNRLSYRQIAVIDEDGNEVLPYKPTPLTYSFSDGVFSLTGDTVERIYYTKIPNEEMNLNESIFGDYTPNEEQTILIQPRFYDESGKELFDSSGMRNATPIENGYFLSSVFKDKSEPKFAQSDYQYVIMDKNGNAIKNDLINTTAMYGDGWSFGKYDSNLNLIYEVQASNVGNDNFAISRISDGLIRFSSTILFDKAIKEDNIISGAEKIESGDSTFYVGNGPKRTGYFDVEGNIIIPQNDDYNLYGDFSNGLAWVAKYKDENNYNSGYNVGFINKKGELAIPMIYDDAFKFENGYALVKSEDKWKYIDTSGTIIFELNGYSGKISTNGKIVTASKNSGYGAVDINNNEILPFEYDDISGIQNDTCMAVKDGKVYSIKFKSNFAPTLGDFSGDGIIDGRDASDVLTFYAKNSVGDAVITADQLAVGDVNKDNILDGRDASNILSYYAKTSTGYTGTITDFNESIKTES